MYIRDKQDLAPDLMAFLRAVGHENGLAQGKIDTLIRLLDRRFGPTPADLSIVITKFSSEQLDALADAVLDFRSLADALAWVAAAAVGS